MLNSIPEQESQQEPQEQEPQEQEPQVQEPQVQEPQEQEVGSVHAKRKKPLIIGACVLVLLVAIGIFAGIQQKKADERASYIASLNELRIHAIAGGAVAEKLCNITMKVWHNTIFEERSIDTDKYTRTLNGIGAFHDDFNTSLSMLYADDGIQTTITTLQTKRETVDGIMKDLQNPSPEFQTCYDTADSLYDAYCDLIDLAISPDGSFKTYSENFGEYDSDLLKYYKKLETLIPSE